MNIIGPEELIFGVEDIDACRTYLTDFGLNEVNVSNEGCSFEALDGTCLTLRQPDDPTLPSPLATATKLRKTIWGVKDQDTLDEIVAELGKDRDVVQEVDGSISCRDDMEFAIGFRVTKRRELDLPAELINSPGAAPGRPPNQIAANEDAEAKPRTLSHIVYFVPDMEKMSRFYIDRLKFVITDKFTNTGPFLRPQGNSDHHVLFMIQTPSYMQGIEHLAFHMQGPTELMLAGSRMIKKGYESFWGPGRHKFGSNWFWYFSSPMGVNIEYDADMDHHDGDWVEREASLEAESSQMFLFENVVKWTPGGGPPDKG